MRVSDVITNITKHNMNVMASTFSALKHVKRWRDKKKKKKKKKKKSANQNELDTKMFLTF